MEPTINIQGVIFPISELYDRDLYAADVVVPVFHHPDQKTPQYYVNPGKYIGKVWSHIMRQSQMFWQLESTPGTFIYVPHESKSLSLDAIKQQGAKSQVEIDAEKAAKERAENSFLGIDWQNIDLSSVSSAKNYIIIGLILIALIFIFK